MRLVVGMRCRTQRIRQTLTMSRVEDISSAVDYLTTLSYVDSNRIGALGICAGSGYTIKASTLDRRIKTVATV